MSFSVTPRGGSPASTQVALAVDFRQEAGARTHAPTLMVRVRDPTNTSAISHASVAGGGTGGVADCVVADVLPGREIVVVRPTASA